jgi:WXXGXW repeat (2 copies)
MLILRYHCFLLPAIATLLLASVPIQAQAPPPGAGDAAQELTRGPIHEAFGQPAAFNPKPGQVIAKAPPEAIEELPPDQKPEGENIAWMPGYWQWDDEGKTFLWVSGFWRAVPPSRSWVGGYWNKVDAEYQWVSGYWTSEKATEVEYLPPPPESLEAGPSTEAVGQGQIWMPGCWMWSTTRYAWRPGYWAVGNADWVWSPAHYVWTPGGYVFNAGYWDYPLFHRGLLFAPVAFASIGPGFVYTPSIVLDFRFLSVSLFARPSYQHYYFGDYYASSYIGAGIYPWFSFHQSRYGYDPLFEHTRFVYARHDPRWESQIRESYIYRRDTESARPPHTFKAYSEWARKDDGAHAKTLALARPLGEVSKDREFQIQLKHVDAKQAAVTKNQIKQVREFRDQRATLDQTAAKEVPRAVVGVEKQPGRTSPVKVKMPDAPRLVATGTGTAVAPPDTPRIPDVSPKVPATAEPKGKPRTLPDPEDIIRRDPGTAVPPPKGKGPAVEPPAKKEPPTKVEPPVTKEAPPKGPPPTPAPPPSKEKPPAKKDKDKG